MAMGALQRAGSILDEAWNKLGVSLCMTIESIGCGLLAFIESANAMLATPN